MLVSIFKQPFQSQLGGIDFCFQRTIYYSGQFVTLGSSVSFVLQLRSFTNTEDVNACFTS